MSFGEPYHHWPGGRTRECTPLGGISRMSTDISQPSLGQHLGTRAVSRVVTKGLFGGYFVRFSPLFWGAGLWVFEKGAVLGRARSDRLEIVARMLSQPGRERDACDFLRRTGIEQIKQWVEEYGKEPDSFHDFWAKTQFEGIDLLDLDMIKRLSNKKYRLGEVLPKLNEWLARGIGFGAASPELTESMWRNTYEVTRDEDRWVKAARAELSIPDQPARLTLEEMQHLVLFQVAEYAAEYFPELIKPLGLLLPEDDKPKSLHE